MDSQANSLTPSDTRAGLAGAPPASASPAALAGGEAQFGGNPFAQRLAMFLQARGAPRAPLVFAVALLIAMVAAFVLWSRASDYKVLFSNLSDRDGGAIIAVLQQANVPYQFADVGGAILVPSDQVHEMRLRLAAQGLPKGGSVGFELMDNQKFGISEFAEQVNYQRALEGELERTIESISSVREARVHLAIPKPSIFVREREAPSASVFVNLYSGRTLDEGQVIAITHMVASAVPEMPVKDVTIVDQDGNLLTQASSSTWLDPSQLKYVRQVEHDTQQRIDAILAPLFGAGNTHSQVSADVDFSKVEQTAESYGPNGTPAQAAIRSQQTSASSESTSGVAQGVPGALSNTPPQRAAAPIDAPLGTTGTAPAAPASERKDATTNYELDKTVRHTEQTTGKIQRLSVAVVVNNMPVTDSHGRTTMQPVPAELLAKVNQLVKDAMGYNAQRGDSVNVVNSAFTKIDDPLANIPWWRTSSMIALDKSIATWLGAGAAVLFVYLAIVKPSLRRALPPPSAKTSAAPALGEPGSSLSPSLSFDNAAQDSGVNVELMSFENEKHKFERNLEYARTIARQDPKIVAMVVKNWVVE
jgi:flagellar M-ring protein FliF